MSSPIIGLLRFSALILSAAIRREDRLADRRLFPPARAAIARLRFRFSELEQTVPLDPLA